jgi:hypothetical protein
VRGCCHVQARGRVKPCSPMGGDEAVTKGAENGSNPVYCCQGDAGLIRGQALDCVMEVIHCLF